ncbi:RagB/SusD family nutrient uptake outer membrane protein [Paraflavitalea speifideaquila]|uniref:RagB/SusD family nutrient uptake outer membrane protein n=1 Tax=Paraflavitalea speifideaquila TaxID=3076558 RepID=UPI0028E50BE7|nr:RagB/SusD family nutrient uptake outer membrane protein [Paraflavitalea speifideiaquila]
MYFNLVRMFGKVPLVLLEKEPLTPQAATVAEIYDQVHKDLDAAESVLPASYDPGNGRGRATKGLPWPYMPRYTSHKRTGRRRLKKPKR